MLEAGGRFEAVPDETDDFGLAWSYPGDDPPAGGRPAPVWAMLKAVDSTFTVNTERPFQAPNAKAYAVELLSAGSDRKSPRVPSRHQCAARLPSSACTNN